jgi:type II secretory pathway component PulK
MRQCYIGWVARKCGATSKCAQRRGGCCNSQGSVLVLVLVVISFMTAIAFGLAYQTRIEIRLSNAAAQRARTLYLAQSGIELCKAVLAAGELSPEQAAGVCGIYPANDNMKLFEQLEETSSPQPQLVCWIADENAMLDLNKSDSASWENLDGFSRDWRASLLDWKDADSDTNPGGAETDYYEQMQTPYACKNAPFVFLKEVLLVKDIDRQAYIGDIATAKLDNAETLYTFIEESAAWQTSFVNRFTVHGGEKININTVSGEILAAMPGLDGQAGETVAAFRAGPDGFRGTDDDMTIRDANDISLIEGLTELQAELLGQYCCFNSDTFRVFSYARLSAASCLLMATVKVTEGNPVVLCAERLL